MIKVQQVNPAGSVSTQALGTPQARTVDNNLDAVGRGLSDLGRGLEQFDIRRAETVADERRLKYQKAGEGVLYNPESGYYTSAGKNAYENRQTTLDSLKKIRTEIEEGLSGREREMFIQAADKMDLMWGKGIDTHAARGFKAYELGVQQASVEDAIESGALGFNNDDEINIHYATLRLSVAEAADIEGVTGKELTERQQNATSTYFAKVIARAGEHDLERANALLEKHRGKLEVDDLDKVVSGLEGKNNLAQAQLSADMWLESGLTLNQGLKAAKDIDDPKLREVTERRWKVVFGDAEKQRKEFVADTYNRHSFDIEEGRTTYDSIPDAELRELSPAQRNSLRALEERRLGVGKSKGGIGVNQDDLDLYDEILSNINSGDMRKARELYLDNTEKFKPSTRKELSKATTKSQAESGEFRLFTNKQMITSFAKENIKNEEDKQSFYNATMKAVNQWKAEFDKEPTSEDMNKIIADMVFEDDGGWFGSSFKTFEKDDLVDATLVNLIGNKKAEISKDIWIDSVNRRNENLKKAGFPPMDEAALKAFGQLMKDNGHL